MEPFGAARTQVRAMPGNHGMRCRCGQRWTAQLYKDPRYRRWCTEALKHFRRVRPAEPFAVPVELSLVVVMRFLESDRRKTRFVPRRWHEARPDWDNVGKAVCDVAQEAGWLTNDWLVARVVLEKVYAAQGEAPSISVVMRPLEPYGR